MKPVHQTTFRPSEGDGAGNCLAAALASVLELALDEVPNFSAIEGENREWFRAMEAWLRERGYGLGVWYLADNPAYYTSEGVPLLVTGKSPRGDWNHTVVCVTRGDQLVYEHDPHPSGDFLHGEPIEAWAVVRL